MFNSELRNATQLVREFDAQVRGQRKDKRDILVRIEKNERLVTISKRN
jgi:hypothetical protein